MMVLPFLSLFASSHFDHESTIPESRIYLVGYIRSSVIDLKLVISDLSSL